MRVISYSKLRAFWTQRRHRDAQIPLTRWYDLVSGAAWQDPADVKAAFGVNVDFVEVTRTGNTVAVFDAGGNKYRLVAAIHFLDHHFARGRVYVLRVMDHREYDRMRWVDEL